MARETTYNSLEISLVVMQISLQIMLLPIQIPATALHRWKKGCKGSKITLVQILFLFLGIVGTIIWKSVEKNKIKFQTNKIESE